MIYQKDKQISLFDGMPGIADVQAGMRLQVRLDVQQIAFVDLPQALGNLHGWRFADIVDVGLERQSHQGDGGTLFSMLANRGADMLDHPLGLAKVDGTGLADQLGMFRIAVDNEPRIDRDAVPPHTDAGL